jgi:retron-type reverse transcriptase
MEKNGPDLLVDIFRAYYDARRNKRNSKQQIAFEMDLEHNLVELYEQIRDRKYEPAPGVCFIVDRPVKREIFASQFKDRVVHHLLFNYLSPLFEARMIFDSYSCRKGKGTSEGIRRIEHHIRSCTRNYTCNAYVLELDLRGYFMSITKEQLYQIIRRTLARCRDRPSGNGLRWGERLDMELVDFLLRRIIFRNPTQGCQIRGSKSDWNGLPRSKSLLMAPAGVGLPIGDLTSQLFSNIYLGQLDEYVKRVLRCKHYGRYVDDFYIVHESRNFLKEQVPKIRRFLRQELKLELHPDKIRLQHYSRGTAFLGAYVKPYRCYPTKRTVALFHESIRRLERECAQTEPGTRRLEEMLSVINSYCGHLRQFKAYNVLEKQFRESPICKYFFFTKGYAKAKIKARYRSDRRKGTREDRMLDELLADGRRGHG